MIQTIVLEFRHIIETETIQTKGAANMKITDHENIQIIDQTIIFITIDHVKIFNREIQII